jgi:DNA (cytosine-5)-methyltransferase 1
LIGVSLFTGAGGLDIGMERAGFVPRFVTDLDESCVKTLRLNQESRIIVNGGDATFLQDAEICRADICNLNGRTVANRIRKRIDCVYGGPPCQSFSSSGKMGSIMDPRGLLAFEFCRFVAEARPRTFILENVRGLVTARCKGGEPGGVLLQLIEKFKEAGYGVNVGLLNSADFGSPQRRVRCFVYGVDSGRPPALPMSTHGRLPAQSGLFERKLPWNTLGDYLKTHADHNTDHWVRPTLKLERELRDLPVGSGLKSAGLVETTRPGGHWGYRQGTFIADPKLPARTVTGSSSQDWIRLGDGSLRRLTLSEVAGLQGFPKGWIFYGTKAARFQQVGNAVPAILGEVMGRAIRKYLATYRVGRAPESWPLPQELRGAMDYVRKEELRNGPSRRDKISAAGS